MLLRDADGNMSAPRDCQRCPWFNPLSIRLPDFMNLSTLSAFFSGRGIASNNLKHIYINLDNLECPIGLPRMIRPFGSRRCLCLEMETAPRVSRFWIGCRPRRGSQCCSRPWFHPSLQWLQQLDLGLRHSRDHKLHIAFHILILVHRTRHHWHDHKRRSGLKNTFWYVKLAWLSWLLTWISWAIADQSTTHKKRGSLI